MSKVILELSEEQALSVLQFLRGTPVVEAQVQHYAPAPQQAPVAQAPRPAAPVAQAPAPQYVPAPPQQAPYQAPSPQGVTMANVAAAAQAYAKANGAKATKQIFQDKFGVAAVNALRPDQWSEALEAFRV